MNFVMNYLSKHKFTFHTLAFCLMLFPAAILYASAQNGTRDLSYGLLGLVIFGNLLALIIKRPQFWSGSKFPQTD